jgi:hypothetical protein
MALSGVAMPGMVARPEVARGQALGEEFPAWGWVRRGLAGWQVRGVLVQMD